MPDLAALIAAGAAHPWLYLPAALVLGALHALEPGHSKSLMAAFIIAIRGTVRQAVLLGLSAAVGHTLIVWLLAVIGLSLGEKLIAEHAEPWLVLISGVLVMLLALRLIWSIRRHTRDDQDHDHPDHDHHDHDFLADDADAHAAAHAAEISTRFAGRQSVTPWEVLWFGFTGGLLPCPAAIAVLLVCLQIRAFGLGLAMVAAFGLGLAITLVGVGVVAAWGAARATRALPGYEVWAARLPLVSAGMVLALGVFVTLRGLLQLGVA